MQIRVFGGSLHSVLVAALLAKNESSRVTIVLAGQEVFLKSWQAARIDGVAIDNGHHALQVPRAYELVEFLVTNFGIDFVSDDSEDLLWIAGENVLANSSLADWPLSLRRLIGEQVCRVHGSLDFLESKMNVEYLNLLKSISRRYADDWKSCRHLMIPWYLPGNFTVSSRDEGTVMRNLVSLGLIKKVSVRPRAGTFESLIPPILQGLESLGVTIERGGDSYPRLRSTNVPKALLSETTRSTDFRLSLFEISGESYIRNFSELLIADPSRITAARLWPVKQVHSGQRLYVLESFEDPSSISNSRAKSEESLVAEILGIERRQLSLKGSLLSRRLQIKGLPDNSEELTTSNVSDVGVRDGVVTVSPNERGPVNMAKVWKSAIATVESVRGYL